MTSVNNSLLVNLYESVHGEKVQSVGKKYFEETQTMFHEAKAAKSSIQLTESKQMKEFYLEPDQYKDIAEERIKYLIVDRNDFWIDEEICIKEVKGLVPTGRNLYKHILNIKTSLDEKGLKENYTIISF